MAATMLATRPATASATAQQPTDEAKLLLAYRAHLLRELAEVDRQISQVSGL